MSHNSLFAFVLMPFDQILDGRYRLGIKETAKELAARGATAAFSAASMWADRARFTTAQAVTRN